MASIEHHHFVADPGIGAGQLGDQVVFVRIVVVERHVEVQRHLDAEAALEQSVNAVVVLDGHSKLGDDPDARLPGTGALVPGRAGRCGHVGRIDEHGAVVAPVAAVKDGQRRFFVKELQAALGQFELA